MSHSAKILPFPSRLGTGWLPPNEAELTARDFLGIPFDERSDEDRQRSLSSPDVLLSICALLREKRDLAPAAVETDASDIYRWISRLKCDLGLFDERDYFLGETALLAGAACRQLGKPEEAFLWLDRAEAGFRHTMNPAPGLANVAYARLALRFEMGRYQDVLELCPSLEASFKKLRMPAEAAKCRLLFATTLKLTGENAKAIELLDRLPHDGALEAEPFLRARIFAELGDLRQQEGQLSLAMEAFQDALTLLQGKETSSASADLKLYVGAAYKALGSLRDATDAFRAAQRDYLALGMRGLVAYAHLLIAETLLEMRRDREAEWEILAALPAIDEMRMVPEGFAAAALLRESVARRKTNVPALQRLREQLQART
jgi:tetratricopeptide (TPR) repeat protein